MEYQLASTVLGLPVPGAVLDQATLISAAIAILSGLHTARRGMRARLGMPTRAGGGQAHDQARRGTSLACSRERPLRPGKRSWHR